MEDHLHFTLWSYLLGCNYIFYAMFGMQITINLLLLLLYAITIVEWVAFLHAVIMQQSYGVEFETEQYPLK